jgi:hypothetical protein
MIEIELPVPFDTIKELTRLFMKSNNELFPEESQSNIYGENHIMNVVHSPEAPYSGRIEIWKISNTSTYLSFTSLAEDMDCYEEYCVFTISSYAQLANFLYNNNDEYNNEIDKYYSLPYEKDLCVNDDDRYINKIKKYMKNLFEESIIQFYIKNEDSKKFIGRIGENEHLQNIPNSGYDRKLVKLLQEGKNAKDIALELGVDRKTIFNRESELRRLYGKELVPYRQKWRNRDK